MSSDTGGFRLRFHPLRNVLTVALAASVMIGCSSAEEQPADTTPATGGKGDMTLTTAQCEEEFEAYEPCPEIDEDSATLEELEANIACLEDLSQSPVWECCESDELSSSAFCQERVEEGRDLTCGYAHDSYQECALSETFGLGACRAAFLNWDDAGWECCSRLDTTLCDGPREPEAIADINDLTERILEADGYFQLSPLADQMHPVDVLPGQLQESLPLYQNEYATNWLAADTIEIDLDDPDAREQFAQETQLALHEVERRLPVQYTIRGFGERIREDILEADAYVTFWETTEGRIVLATHYYESSTVGLGSGGWLHGPTFVLPEGSVCDALSTQQREAPGLGTLSLALDAANGRPAESCLSDLFQSASLDSEEMRSLEIYLTARYRTVAGDDSRINTIEAAHRIDTPGFNGVLVEMLEVPSEETQELLPDLEPRRARLLLNEKQEIVHKFDDQACEQDPTMPNTPSCMLELR